jgi:hypothetical protein
LPGFRNCKNDPSHPITVKYPRDSTSNPGDFRLDIAAATASPLSHAIPSRERPGKHTNSEHEWAWILHEFAHGKGAAKLTRTIASRRSDNPVLFIYAQRTVNVASARLCLIEGVPIEDVCRAEITSARCIRKGPSKDAAEPLTARVESGAFVRVLKV